MKKAFDKKKDIASFQHQYKNGLINTEVISNLIQPYYIDKYPALKNYYDFWMPKSLESNQVMNLFSLIYIKNIKRFLESYFGKADFIFHGNHKYKNYILKFEDLMIICSEKSEVVIDDVTSDSIIALHRWC